jgi:hypothetical protein
MMMILVEILSWNFLQITLKRKSLGSIFFFFFGTKYNERKGHNMLALTLHPRFKRLKLMSSFIGREHGVTTTEKYDRKSFFPMLLKSYHHLHPLSKVESYLFIEGMKIKAQTFLRWFLTPMNL